MRLAGWGDALASVSRSPWSPSPWPSSAPWCAGIGFRTVRTRAAIDPVGGPAADPAAALRQSGGVIRGVQFLLPDDGRWVDAAGQDVHDPPAPGSYLVLSDASGPVLRLLLGRRADQGEVLAGRPRDWAGAAQRPAAAVPAPGWPRSSLPTAGGRDLGCRTPAHRARPARRRPAAAGQRRLPSAVALAGADPETAERLTGAETQVRDALARLRRLAHGIFPSVLADEGLGAALDELVAASDVPATLTVRVNDVADAPAMAAYATVVAALDAVDQPSAATRARVSVVQDGDTMTVQVEVTGGDGIIAAGLHRRRRPGRRPRRAPLSPDPAEKGTMTVAVIPCGS